MNQGSKVTFNCQGMSCLLILTLGKIQSFTGAQGAYLDSSDVFCKS